MDANKAILLQKQVRDNSEDIQKEFLDMEAWEKQMKKKDLEIRNSKDNQVLPPVRSKEKKKSSSSNELLKDEKPNKTKRIKGSDYSSWDKFNADKACEEMEEKNDSIKSKEKVYEIPSKEVLEKEHAEATKYKDEGNALVQKQEYAKAVGKYSQAIKIFPHDAVFYANRALCQLKLDNLYSAEADCTAAVQLDSTYIKGYYRRALARIELKRYIDAQTDIETVIKLDPTNKEAICLLAQIQRHITKSSKASTNTFNKKCDIEKKIGEKSFEKKDAVSSPNKNLKIDEQNEVKNVKVQQAQASISKEEKTDTKQVIQEKSEITEKLKKQTKQIKTDNVKKSTSLTNSENIRNERLRPWLPKLKEGISIIQPVTEIPRRLNQTLERIPIKEVPMNESIFKGIEEVKEEKIDKQILKEENIVKCSNLTKPENKNNSDESCKNDPQINENLPPLPKSFVGFLINWRKNTSFEFRYKYFKQISPKDLPGIFKESMESNIFSEIISILNTKFIPNEDKVYDTLFHLSKVKRFRTLILFKTQADIDALNNLFKYCRIKEGRTDEEVSNLFSTYEM